MKTIFDKPSVTLLSVALLFSKMTQTIVTIKYGDVTITNRNQSVILRFNDCEEFQIFLNDYKKKEWIVYYPVNQLSNLDRLYGLLIYALDCLITKQGNSFISIPNNYLSILKERKTIYLDRFFCLTNEKYDRQYRIHKTRIQYVLSIILPGNDVSDFKVTIFGRSGDGNEDL